MRTTIFIILISAAQQALSCELEESEILGAYSYIDGGNFFEEFSVEAGGEFMSWLHGRPASNGTWQFNDCTLVIEIGMPESIRLKIISLTPTEAVIQTDSINEYAKYKRM